MNAQKTEGCNIQVTRRDFQFSCLDLHTFSSPAGFMANIQPSHSSESYHIEIFWSCSNARTVGGCICNYVFEYLNICVFVYLCICEFAYLCILPSH